MHSRQTAPHYVLPRLTSGRTQYNHYGLVHRAGNKLYAQLSFTWPSWFVRGRGWGGQKATDNPTVPRLTERMRTHSSRVPKLTQGDKRKSTPLTPWTILCPRCQTKELGYVPGKRCACVGPDWQKKEHYLSLLELRLANARGPRNAAFGLADKFKSMY